MCVAFGKTGWSALPYFCIYTESFDSIEGRKGGGGGGREYIVYSSVEC